jgi:hypothetical protein
MLGKNTGKYGSFSQGSILEALEKDGKPSRRFPVYQSLLASGRFSVDLPNSAESVIVLDGSSQ